MLSEEKKKYWEEYKPKQILAEPNAGWSCFSFNDTLRVSYIDPMPYFVLDSIFLSLKEGIEFCVTFDAEGYSYSILSPDNYFLECIIRQDESKIIELDITYKEFCYDFVFTIEENIDKWWEFPCNYEDYTKESIITKIKEIKELLKTKLWY